MVPTDLAGWEAMTRCTTSTYRVGLFRDIHRRRLRYGMRYLVGLIRLGQWRSVRNYFNGWLCELDNDGINPWATKCGRGWTQRAAQRRLVRHLIRRAEGKEL